MQDKSDLDKKYFVDDTVYNCPFCNRRNVAYHVIEDFAFDWSADKTCFLYLVECSYCDKTSMHLSYENILDKSRIIQRHFPFKKDIDIDTVIFYSVPTSFFVIDSRVPRILRELITEAEGCLKMNYLTGASACTRKSIYELLDLERVEGPHYEGRIKSLKKKYPDSDPTLFDILVHIQDMTSEKVHEQSWDKWDSSNLKLLLETIKTVLYEIYVLPQLKRERSLAIQRLQEGIKKDKDKGRGKTTKKSR